MRSASRPRSAWSEAGAAGAASSSASDNGQVDLADKLNAAAARSREATAAAAAKREWITQLRGLQTKATAIERDQERIVAGSRGPPPAEYTALTSARQELDAARNRDLIALRHQLQATRELVSKFRRHMTLQGAGVDYVNELKRLMDQVEGAITQLRLKARTDYEGLEREEQQLTREMAAFEERVEQWPSKEDIQAATAAVVRGGEPQASGASRRRTSVPRAAVSGMDLVAAIDEEIASLGGPTGGWPEDDHRVFLAVVKRLVPKPEAAADDASSDDDDAKVDSAFSSALAGGKSRQPLGGITNEQSRAIVNACVTRLVVRSSVEIEDHLEWYLNYDKLLSRKKLAISEWRRRKEEKATQAATEIEQNEEVKPTGPSAAEIAAREAKQRQLLAWKARKEADQLAEQLAAERDARIAEQTRKERERARQAEIKAEVERYKAEREAEAARQQETEKALTQASVNAPSAEELARRAARDLERARERHRQMEDRKAQEKAAQALPQAPKVPAAKAARDPERLLQPTAAAIHHASATKQEREDYQAAVAGGAHNAVVPGSGNAAASRGRDFTFGGNVRRATPSWRQGL